MSCLGSIGVVGLGIVPRRVGGAPSFAKATADRLPRTPGFFEAWTEARDAGSGARFA